MLHGYCSQFLECCRLADSSNRSTQPVRIRLSELRSLGRTRQLKSIKDILCPHAEAITANFNHLSIRVRKSRISDSP
jgi:hypothetical protein